MLVVENLECTAKYKEKLKITLMMELQVIFNDYIGILNDCIGKIIEHLYSLPPRLPLLPIVLMPS